MKKNLNIAYLNGAEGMIRRGGASSGGGESGGSGSGSGSGDEHVIYYSFGEPVYGYKFQEYGLTPTTHVRAKYNGKYMYGSYLEVEMKFGAMSMSAYPDACMFSPLTVRFPGDNWVTYTCYEDIVKDCPSLPPATRITAEEYWEHFNAE